MERLVARDIGSAEIVDYVREINERGLRYAADALRDTVVRFLDDPRVLAELAVGLWRAGFQDECGELLRRWLERDRLVDPEAVAVVLLTIRDLPERERTNVLLESVGRWPQNRRELAVAALRRHAALQAEAGVLSS